VTVLLGLLAALFWGVSSLCVRFSGRGIGAYRTLFFAQFPGLLVMSAWLLLDRAIIAAAVERASWQGWLAACGAAPLVLFGSFSLFRALTVGALCIVSPISASYGAVTAVLSFVAGEALGAATLVGIAITVIGVALASTPTLSTGKRNGTLDGVGWALLSAAAYGVGLWLQGGLAVPALGSLLPLWLYYATGALGLALLARPAGQEIGFPERGFRLVALGTGTTSICAYLSFILGLGSGEVAVVTVLSSLQSGVAALLGRVVLGEKLARHQWAGVVAILVGIVLVNSGR
jgi:drug/metabolite transporter (DMT)-like permease